MKNFKLSLGCDLKMNISFVNKSFVNKKVMKNSNVNRSAIQNEIKSLQKRKMELSNKIEGIKEKHLDKKSERNLIKAVQEQIQLIEEQIQEKISQKSQENNSNNKKKSVSKQKNKLETMECKKDTFEMSDLLNCGICYDKMKILNKTKNSMNRKVKILEEEIKFDERNGESKTVKRKRKSALRFKNSAHKIDKEISKKSGKLLNKVNSFNLKAYRDNEINKKEIDKDENKDINLLA